MKKRIFGIVFAALGLLIALGPQFLFKVCPVMSDMYMKCHWTAQTEIGIGAVIAILGILLALLTDPKTRLGFVVGILLTGILALLIPHVLIGGCPMHTMPCRKVAIPALTAISSLLIIISAVYTTLLARKNNR